MRSVIDRVSIRSRRPGSCRGPSRSRCPCMGTAYSPSNRCRFDSGNRRVYTVRNRLTFPVPVCYQNSSIACPRCLKFISLLYVYQIIKSFCDQFKVGKYFLNSSFNVLIILSSSAIYVNQTAYMFPSLSTAVVGTVEHCIVPARPCLSQNETWIGMDLQRKDE